MERRDVPSMKTLVALEQQLQLGGSPSLIYVAALHAPVEEKCGELFARFVGERDQRKLLEFSLCAASVVCPDELATWSACVRGAMSQGAPAREMDRCRGLKRDLERCGRQYTAELLEPTAASLVSLER
jgi:hypothetical protein